ncbi:transcription antitermination factor NusB [Carnobacteriaceae bacterium zg-ZUI252]|nr:transcription antitermination factor NusB [Carnobacteriaceae bacterium zg-ZUI252]MBS4770241.1 transcription antitermination factor NusB [Carnobacteriaceae bacterium zg-ZUI240]
MAKVTFNRRTRREKIIQSLFSLSMDDAQSVEQAVLTAVNYNDSSDNDHDFQVADVETLIETIESLNELKIEIDERIQQQLENWNFTRITKIDLAILRLAIYEMFYVSDESVPKKVAINEAIEIAKRYSDDKSPKFINGVLSNLLKKEEV